MLKVRFLLKISQIEAKRAKVVTSNEPKRLRNENGASKVLGIYFCRAVVVARSLALSVPLSTKYEKSTKENAKERDIKRQVFEVTTLYFTSYFISSERNSGFQVFDREAQTESAGDETNLGRGRENHDL